jgi:hypothetical protein
VAERSSPRLPFGLALAWLAITVAVISASGCYGDNCLGEVVIYGAKPNEGRMIDENTWESSAQDGTWLPFPRARSYLFDLRQLGDRQPEIVLPYISPVERPNQQPSNFTLGGGNLSEISGAAKNRVNVRNGTCADYYLRLVVVASPRPPAAGPSPDASADAAGGDGGAGGGGSDASTDGANPDSGDAEAGS